MASDAGHVGASGQPPELFDGGIDPRLDLGGGADVRGNREQFAFVFSPAAGFDVFDCALQSVLVDV